MKTIIALCFVAFVARASAQCDGSGGCNNLKWAVCEQCRCTIPVDDGQNAQLDCTKLIPKCILMKAEMYRARNKLSTRTFGGKPVETAVVDNDGIYDPECENDGRFKAVQCNKTDTCWCVNSAGVRRSDKGDKNIKCEPVETYWVRLELKHKTLNSSLPTGVAKLKTGIENAILERYGLGKEFVKEVQYDPDSRTILVDVVKTKGADKATDLPRIAYYMEKDVKVLPIFKDQTKTFLPRVEGTPVPMENILVYYVDEKDPTITMQRLTGGVIAVIVVVVLAVVIGLLVLYFMRRREQAQYSKAQPRELENMST